MKALPYVGLAVLAVALVILVVWAVRRAVRRASLRRLIREMDQVPWTAYAQPDETTGDWNIGVERVYIGGGERKRLQPPVLMSHLPADVDAMERELKFAEAQQRATEYNFASRRGGADRG